MNNYLLFLLGIMPLALLIILILKIKMAIHQAILVSLVVTLVLAATVWHTSILDLTQGVMYGVLKGLWPITIVILAAIFSYNLMLHTKSMDVLRNLLTSISSDQRIQVLLVAWCFGGFLEASAGYGTAVAIPIGILMALGFDPIKASVASLVANTVPTAFGAIGIPVSILASQVNLPVLEISSAIIIQLAVFNIVLPFVIVAIIGGSIKAIKGIVWITLACGIATLIPQYYVATYLGAELPAFAGSITSLVVVTLLAKKSKQTTLKQYQIPSQYLTKHNYSTKQILNACSIYIITLVFILLCSPLFPAIKNIVGLASNTFNFHLSNQSILALKIEWIATPGVLIVIASIIGGTLQGAKLCEMWQVFCMTVKKLQNSIIAIAAIVAMATIMDISGLISDVANTIVLMTGGSYIFLAPIIGALGTFVTGSDTNSNVLFGKLQTIAADKLNIDPVWLAAANTSGATGGKMISPQSIAIAVSAAGLEKQSGQIMANSLKYCAVYIVILGLKVGLIYHLFMS